MLKIILKQIKIIIILLVYKVPEKQSYWYLLFIYLMNSANWPLLVLFQGLEGDS